MYSSKNQPTDDLNVECAFAGECRIWNQNVMRRIAILVLFRRD